MASNSEDDSHLKQKPLACPGQNGDEEEEADGEDINGKGILLEKLSLGGPDGRKNFLFLISLGYYVSGFFIKTRPISQIIALLMLPTEAFLRHAAIFPTEYKPGHIDDATLGPNGGLRVYLDGLAKAADVPAYVKGNPFGEAAISANHPDWDFYSNIIVHSKGKKSSVSGDRSDEQMISNKPSGVTGGAGAGKAPGGASTRPGSGSGAAKDGTMKAPGQDVRISREAFEKNPAGYFQDLRKK
ncbi:unnamed protein product [Dovyalis caffra]|uniref:Uncharacterized protein n=1 Tax=Dovyalis caffra TaxID=77055 RepID=A0AAV1QWZ6_9ROSI|nr:unnamed protein product [Dovyalis caffra]